jgi:hypothetical protein
VRSNGKLTARERIERELIGSLARSGDRFMVFKRDGFCIRFDLTDGIWRGDITTLRVACTKDNTHRAYRRLRKWMRMRLHGQSAIAQAKRRRLIAICEMPVAA